MLISGEHILLRAVNDCFGQLDEQSDLRKRLPLEEKTRIFIWVSRAAKPRQGIEQELGRALASSREIAKLLTRHKNDAVGQKAVSQPGVLCGGLSGATELASAVYSGTSYEGREREAVRTFYLVRASECIYVNLGHYYDQQLAAFYSKVDPEGEEIDGGAIGKRRARFKTRFPLDYKRAKSVAQCRSGLSDGRVRLIL